MEYFKSMLRRTHAQQLIGFIKYGTEGAEVVNKSCEERVRQAEHEAMELLREKLSDEEFNQIEDTINNYVTVVAEAHLEIGIKCGAQLMMQLCGQAEE